MISGLGTDIVSIERIRKTIERHGDNLLNRVFTSDELVEAAERGNPIEYFAGRWCAKEALSKALKCGIGAKCAWQDINILNDKNGAPAVTLSGTALETSRQFDVKNIHISISHEREFATATVILEK